MKTTNAALAVLVLGCMSAQLACAVGVEPGEGEASSQSEAIGNGSVDDGPSCWGTNASFWTPESPSSCSSNVVRAFLTSGACADVSVYGGRWQAALLFPPNDHQQPVPEYCRYQWIRGTGGPIVGNLSALASKLGLGSGAYGDVPDATQQPVAPTAPSRVSRSIAKSAQEVAPVAGTATTTTTQAAWLECDVDTSDSELTHPVPGGDVNDGCEPGQPTPSPISCDTCGTLLRGWLYVTLARPARSDVHVMFDNGTSMWIRMNSLNAYVFAGGRTGSVIVQYMGI